MGKNKKEKYIIKIIQKIVKEVEVYYNYFSECRKN